MNGHKVLNKSENNKFTFECSLIHACAHNNKAAVEFLLDIGTNVNYQDANDLMAIKVASYFEHMDIVRTLCSRNADLGVVDSDKRTLLMFLLVNKKFNVALHLLKCADGITIDAREKDGWTALMISCQVGHVDIVELLLQKNADPNLQNKDGRSALMIAALHNHMEVIGLLLQKKANSNLQNVDGFTVLMTVCKDKNGLQMMQCLLKHGANPNIQNKDGATALMFASQEGCSEIVDSLLAHRDTDPNLQNKSMSTALMGASQEGFFNVVISLLQNGANPNIQNVDGTTALMIACRQFQYKIAQLLLEYIADPNIQDDNGLTALTVTCIASNEAPSQVYDDIAKLLLQYRGSPLVLLGDSGLTEFGNACLMKNTRMVDLYMQYYEIPVSKIAICLYVACRKGNIDVITLLLSKIPDIDPIFFQLLVACAKGDVAMVVQSSTKFKMDFNVCTVHRITPLMVASSCGHSDVIDVLIQDGASVTNEDDEGHTALDYATNSSVATFLQKSGGVYGSAAVADGGTDMSHTVNKATESKEDLFKDASEKLESLHQKFEELIKKVRASVIKQSSFEGQLNKMVEYVAEYIIYSDKLLVESGEQLFYEIHPYYDFLNCHVVTNLVQRFFGGPLLNKLQEHSTEVDKICKEMSINELVSSWKYIKIDSHYLTSLPKVSVTLESQWSIVSIKGLFLLVQHLLPASNEYLHYSLLKHLSDTTPSPVTIEYGIHQHVEDTKHHVNEIHQFVRLIGVIKLVINGQVIVNDFSDQNFSFEDSLISACGHDNKIAVKFLLDIGANINYRDASGITAIRVAGFYGNTELMDLLLKYNADRNELDDSGANLVSFLLACNKVDTALYLLNRGAVSNIDAQAKDGGYTALMIASEDGSIEVIKSMLKNKANPDIVNKVGKTALMIATQQNKPKAVELLLQENADPNVKGNNEYTALMFAAVCGYEEIVDILLQHDETDPNVQDKNGMTALALASHKGYVKIAKALLQGKAKPDLQNIDGVTALMIANEYDQLQIMKVILESKADPDIVNNVGKTALMIATQQNKPRAVELLLQENADPNVKGNNALMFAAGRGYEEIVDILLQHDITDPNAQDKNGMTALALASHKGYVKIAKALLQGKANPDLQNIDGTTALMIASEYDQLQVMTVILESETDPDIVNNVGKTALITATHKNKPQNVKLLLQENADPNVKDGNEYTALMSAIVLGYTEIVDILLTVDKTDPDVQDKHGFTALIFACQSGVTNLAKMLLQRSADPDLQDADGVTALMIACDLCHFELAELLLQYNADINIKNKKGLTVLTVTSIAGKNTPPDCLAILHLLLKNGASPLVQLGDEPHATEFSNACAIGNKAVIEVYLNTCEIPAKMIMQRFYFACIKGNIELIALLASKLPNTDQQLCSLAVVCTEGNVETVAQHIKGTDPNATIVYGVTPLMIAAACGHVNVIELLVESGADTNSKNQEGYTALDYATMTNHDATVSFLKLKKAVHGSTS